jgi:phospholipid transport system substrate-binding protein
MLGPPGKESVMDTDYSIWAFCYAHSTMPHDFFGGVLLNSNRGTLQIPMVYSAILGGPEGEAPRPIVIDTGMTGAWSPSGNSYPDHETPAQVLAKVGLDPAAIETVLLTHLHFDHIGNLDAFPAATFYVQRREYENWHRVVAMNSRKFLQDLGERAIALLQGPAGPERRSQLQALLRQGVDFGFIGRFALGRHWRKATPAQRASYLERFTDRALKTYATRLASQRQAGFTISGVRPAGRRDVLVQSRITSQAGVLEVDWRVRQRQGSYRVIDVVIAGVSMALTQRSEFATVIRQSGIEGLIAALGHPAKPTEMAAATTVSRQ